MNGFKLFTQLFIPERRMDIGFMNDMNNMNSFFMLLHEKKTEGFLPTRTRAHVIRKKPFISFISFIRPYFMRVSGNERFAVREP